MLSFTSRVVLILAFVGSCFAGTCDAYKCVAKVKELYPHENGKIYVRADADMSPLGCTRDQGVYMVLESSNPLQSEMYSMLLSASIASREVIMRIADGSSNCRLVYTRLTL